MQNQDYKILLTNVIKKQIAILGPQIVLEKVRNISGIKIDVNGQVLEVTDDPQKIIQALIDQFVQLSGLIIKRTIEPLLNYQLDGAFKPEISTNTSSSITPNQTTVPPLSTKPLVNPMPISSNPVAVPQTQSPIINLIPKPNPMPISHDLNIPIEPPIMPTPPPISQPTTSIINNPQITEYKETTPASIDQETQKIINSALNNK